MCKRKLYIDYVKALGIILVILYHCEYVPFDSMLVKGVYAICVPLFFMVNGYLMLSKERTISDLLKKNLKILVLIYSWAFVSTAVTMWTGGDWNANDLIGGGKMLILNSLLSRRPYSNHLWFMKALFVLNLLNPMIYSFIRSNDRRLKYLLVLLVLFSVRFFNTVVCRFENPMLHWVSGFSVLYYVLGYAIFGGHLSVCKIRTWVIGVIAGLAIVCQWVYNWMLLDGPLHSLNDEKMWVIDIVWDGYNAPFVVVLTAAVCLLFQRIEWKEWKLLQYIGKYSLSIYVMQTPVYRMWQMVLPLDDWRSQAPICGVILPIITLATCMIITYLMDTNKYTRYMITI